ncbi:hypothetical protein DRP05_03925 [Archaeoglobales archaeon]|nr:MAG: hypothetical protein DRP05_03925 [Archaeoglobales archaeon]
MDEECKKLLAEKDKEIEKLKKKIMFYELKLTYQDIIEDEELERIVNLPPEQIVIEIGKLLKEDKKRTVIGKKEAALGVGEAIVNIDLAFTQKYDFNNSNVAFVSKNIMKDLGIKEGDQVMIEKDDVVQLKAISYSKPNFVIIPTWAKNKINAKIKDIVKVRKFRG